MVKKNVVKMTTLKNKQIKKFKKYSSMKNKKTITKKYNKKNLSRKMKGGKICLTEVSKEPSATLSSKPSYPPPVPQQQTLTERIRDNWKRIAQEGQPQQEQEEPSKYEKDENTIDNSMDKTGGLIKSYRNRITRRKNSRQKGGIPLGKRM
jgi:hypothetical protein